MSETEGTTGTKAPWHFWVVGIVALLWNSIGATDYLMTQTRNEGYLSQFTPEQLEFFFAFPAWLVALWAIAVWGGVLGALLLLARKRLAVTVFLVSLISMAITTVYNYGISNGMEVVGDTFSLVFTAVIFVIALALYRYARTMQAKGILG
ncbi:MAG: hypothetical protein ACR2QU_06435 [Gammaproteobacteria bacterium]